MATASFSTPSPRFRRAGRFCLASWLGGLDPIHDFNPLQTASGLYLTFFGSLVFHGMQVAGFTVNDLFAAYERQNPGRQK
jgi:hypothetical protein